MLDALEIFKFGPKFQNLGNTVLKNTQSCVHNGGWISSSFTVERGIRRGCPPLFITAVEILAIKTGNSSEKKEQNWRSKLKKTVSNKQAK